MSMLAVQPLGNTRAQSLYHWLHLHPGGLLLSAEHDSELRMAVAEGLLSREEAEAIKEEAHRLGRNPLELLIERGRLSADTLASLRREASSEPVRDTGDPHNDSTLEIPSREGQQATDVPGFPVTGWKRYQCLRLLGQGGMGRVFLAHDQQLRRDVALKFVRDDDPDHMHRFVSEARSQARVSHERVCQVFEVGEVQGRTYIAMQYIDGSPLNQLAKELTLEQKVLVMREVAEGVHAAHRAGLIHRDIKPSNIMVERSDSGLLKPYVMDFGLARDWKEGMTATGSVMGTPHYMAPEQARGEVSRLDRRADVYSLGATLYHLLTGVVPIPGSNSLEVLNNISTLEPRPPRSVDKDIPPDLEAIILKCMEKERSARYDSARAIAEELERFLNGEPVLARSPGLWYRLRKRARKHRSLVAVATGALVLLMLSLGGAGVMLRQTKLNARNERQASELLSSLKDLTRGPYLLPLHDTSEDRQRLLAKMEEIEARLHEVNGADAALLHYALGEGYLALGREEEARVSLEKAQRLEYNTPHASTQRLPGDLQPLHHRVQVSLALLMAARELLHAQVPCRANPQARHEVIDGGPRNAELIGRRFEVPRVGPQRVAQLLLGDLGGPAAGDQGPGLGGPRHVHRVPDRRWRGRDLPQLPLQLRVHPQARLASAGDHHLPRDVAQLADVARPGVAHQPRRQPRRQPRLGRGVRGAQPPPLPQRLQLLPGEVEEEQADVLAARPQRRQADVITRQTVQQRRLEAPVPNLLLQVRIRRGHQAHVGGDGGGPPHRVHLARLQHPQQQHLDLGGRLAHLVQEQRAALRRPEEALAAQRSRIRALLRAEELGRRQVLGNGPQVDTHEALAPASAPRVDGLCHQLLARSRLAPDEHRHLKVRHLLDVSAHPPRRHALPHHAQGVPRRGPRVGLRQVQQQHHALGQLQRYPHRERLGPELPRPQHRLSRHHPRAPLVHPQPHPALRARREEDGLRPAQAAIRQGRARSPLRSHEHRSVPGERNLPTREQLTQQQPLAYALEHRVGDDGQGRNQARRVLAELRFRGHGERGQVIQLTVIHGA